jgi:ketosteroid isomerase-like protein
MATNAAVVQTAYDAFGRGDIPAVIDLLADDVEWSSPKSLPHGGHFTGKAGVGAFFHGIGANWEMLALEVESVSEAGDDLVLGLVRAEGKRTDGSASGYGATHVFTVRGGRVVRFREYTDLDGPLA